MGATVAAQLNPAAGTAIAYLGTFLLAAGFYAVTAHVAARYVLGDVPVSRALLVGPVPAAIAVVLQQYGPAAVLLASLAGDYLAIRAVYRLRYRTAALVALVHYTVSVILGLTLFNLYRLLLSAPA